MDGCEWVSEWECGKRMSDDIAWQECVRYGINIFLDALKFYNIWPLQGKSAAIWLETLREPTQTHQDRRMAQEMDASGMTFVQIYWHKLKTRCWKMMWSDPCATQTLTPMFFFPVIWLPAHTAYILSAGIVFSALFIPPSVCSLCGPLVKKLLRVLVPSVCSRAAFGTCFEQLL